MIREVLIEVSEQRARARFADAVFVGATLWREIGVGALAQSGIPTDARMPVGNTVAYLPMRSFSNDERGDGVDVLLRAPALREVAMQFRAGIIRPANEREREALYLFIPFEIRGEPVTVAERDGLALFVLFDAQGKVRWLDRLTALPPEGVEVYRPRAPAPAPTGERVTLGRIELGDTNERFGQNVTADEVGAFVRRLTDAARRTLSTSATPFVMRVHITLSPQAPGRCDVATQGDAPAALLRSFHEAIAAFDAPRTRHDTLSLDVYVHVAGASPEASSPTVIP